MYITSKKYRYVLLSLIPGILGWIIYSLLTDTNLIENLFQPFRLALFNATDGNVVNNLFLFSFIKEISFLEEYNYFIIIIFTFLLNIIFVLKINKISDDLLKLSLLCLLILISTPHWAHDNILFIPFNLFTQKL